MVLVPPGPAGLKFWQPNAKYDPRTANAWNYEDKSANVVLSNSDKTAAIPGGVNQGVRSTTTRLNGTTGKYYVEFVYTAATPDHVGLLPRSGTITSISGGVTAAANGDIWVNGVNSFVSFGTPTVGDVIGMAWDAGTKTIWFRQNNGNWNNNGTANPATSTGGVDASVTASTAFALYARLGFSGVGDSVTLCTELADFTYSVPSGFTSWMGEEVPVVTVETVGTASGVGAASAVGVAAAQLRTVVSWVELSGSAGTIASGAGAAAGTGTAAGVGTKIAAAVGSTETIISLFDDPTGNGYVIDNSSVLGLAQSFTAVGSSLSSATLDAYVNSGSPTGSITVKVYLANGSHLPTGSQIGSTASVLVSALPSLGTLTRFVFPSDIPLTPATEYCLVFEWTGSGGTVALWTSQDVYSGTFSRNISSTWLVVSGADFEGSLRYGNGAASATGTGIKSANASTAVGTGTASAAGVTIGVGAGAATGIGAATATGSTTTVVASGDGASAGTGAASGVGTGIKAANASSAAGTSTATGAGNALIPAAGTATAIGTASATGALIGAGTGSAAGIGAAAATGRGVASAAGTAAGVGTAAGTAEGGLTLSGVGTAAGTGTANAVGLRILGGAGTAAGTSTATGAGRATAAAVGTVAGTGAASVIGAATGTATGLAAGTSEGAGIGVGVVTSEAVGTAAATGTAAGVGFAILPSATAPERIIVLAADLRLITAALEQRTITTAVENRTIVAVAEDRTVAAELEDRELEPSDGPRLLEAA